MNNSSIVNVLVPNLPESVADATIAIWNKKAGDQVQKNEILLEIETDKIMLEIPAPNTGILESILEKEGSVVTSGQILGYINIVSMHDVIKNQSNEQTIIKSSIIHDSTKKSVQDPNNTLTPSTRKLIAEHNLQLEHLQIQGSGIKGRITRQDVETYIHKEKIAQYNDQKNEILHTNYNYLIEKDQKNRKETRIAMSRLRKKIAERLLNVVNSTATLTTFNEVNMQPIMKLRKKYGELFEKNHKVRLGIMSFYIKAVLKGLQCFPEINAFIEGDEIVYRNYFDISIAVSTDRGLITPVLRDVDTLSMSDIEKNIKSLADKGKNGKLTLEELNGGNFTITNGGIFGSLISTPIINPPQSAILGMHAIKERPIALDGQIVILPMMYVALSYDHRLIDGKDSVSFLTFIKNILEDPIRLLLDV